MFVFVTCCCVQFIVWADEVTFISLLPYWSDALNFTAVQAAGIQSAYMLGMAPMMLIGGIITDIIGPKKVISSGLLACGVLSFMMLFTSGYDAMWWRNFIFGLFFALTWTPVMKLLAAWMPGRERGQRTAIWSLFTSVPTVVMTPIVLWFGVNSDWHYPFAIVAIVCIPIFIMMLKTTDSPEMHKKISKEEVDYIADGRELVQDRISFKTIGKVLKDPNCLLVLFCAAWGSGPTYFTYPWITEIAINGLGMEPGLVGTLSSVFALVPVAFSFTVGFWLNKVFKGNIKLLLVFTPLLGGLPYIICGIGPMLGMAALPAVLIYFLTIFGQSSNTFAWGGINSYWAAYSKPEVWGTVNGIGNVLNVVAGTVFLNISGMLISPDAPLGGFAKTYVIGGSVWFLLTIAALFLKKVTTKDNWRTVAERYGKKE
jgi:MFS family permease